MRGEGREGFGRMTENRVSLRNIADEGFLRKIWKDNVRPMVRSMTFSQINLAPDALHYAAYEWGIKTLVSSLADDILRGRYSPERGEIVRSAKAMGLTRPLCFLAPRDALVYSAITAICKAQLISGARPWVGVEHSDKGQGKVPDGAADSFDWFRFWLEREGRILKMLDDPTVKYLVESDISNFFPSIRLEAVREHLHSKTSLEKEVVRLCVQIVDGVMPRQDYSETSLMGLPQEQSNSSRYIAHSFLVHVDKVFENEGESGFYTRFMDDVLIGVSSPSVGESAVMRWQMGLESLGLYPNGAKTRVIEKVKYLHDAMVDVNAEIEKIDHGLAECTQGDPKEVVPTPELTEAIERVSSAHRALEDRPKRWDRVARRIFTLQRKTGIDSWWQYWYSDIHEFPGSAPHILEYVRSWPLGREAVSHLIDISHRYCQLYPNIALLAAETMATAPVAKDDELWTDIYAACQNHLKSLLGLLSHDRRLDRIAAAWLLPTWKYGNSAQRHSLVGQVPTSYSPMSITQIHAFPLMVALNRSLSEWVTAKPGMAWEAALAAEYLRSLEKGDDAAVGVTISLLRPAVRLLPQRYLIIPRSLPLVEIAGHANQRKLSSVMPGILGKLKRNPDRLRDFRVESELEKWCD
jgi:hypothetical protein